MGALRSRLSTDWKEGCAKGIWSWDVIIPRGDLKERYETKDSTGGFQTEHVERCQVRSVASMVQQQSEETIRNGVHGARPWLDDTPEERAGRKMAALPAFLPSEESTALALTAQGSLSEQEAT